MKNFLIFCAATILAVSTGMAYFLVFPKKLYECTASNNSVMAYLALYPEGQFTISYSFLSKDGSNKSAFYEGMHAEGPNTYDLDFQFLHKDEIRKLFEHTTAGGFVPHSSIYRINKNTNDGANQVYLAGCLLEDVPIWKYLLKSL